MVPSKRFFVFICIAFLVGAISISSAQEPKAAGKPDEKKTAVKKETPKKVMTPEQLALKAVVDKEIALIKKAESVKLAKEQVVIKGFLSQLEAPRPKLRVLALKAIYGEFKKKKISEKTIIPVMLEAMTDTFPVVNVTAFENMRIISGEKMGNEEEPWQKWWSEKEKKAEEKLLKEVEKKAAAGKLGKKKEEKKTDKKPEKKDEEKEEEDIEETVTPITGDDALVKEHNSRLGDLDLLFLKNGREIECYIIFEYKDVDGKLEKYIVQFKGAVGHAEIPASEVDGKPLYDFNKDKANLPKPVVKKP